MVIGGYQDEGSYTADVEVLKISTPYVGNSDCDKPVDYVDEVTSPVGITDSQGQPLVCGGDFATDGQACFSYPAEEDAWIPAEVSTVNPRYFSGVAKLSDGRYWITGGGNSSASMYNNTVHQMC